MIDPLEHWNRVYSSKLPTEVSWFQECPKKSIELIREAAPAFDAAIVDVGGGESRLVDALLQLGYSDLTVLDVSDIALGRAKARLGVAAGRVQWIVADITKWMPGRTWKVWHDRAVFHFLIERAQQNAYIEAMKTATNPGSVSIISTFALDGPDRCSGLPVCRYSAETLADRLGAEFELIGQSSETHQTPTGRTQEFGYFLFKRH